MRRSASGRSCRGWKGGNRSRSPMHHEGSLRIGERARGSVDTTFRKHKHRRRTRGLSLEPSPTCVSTGLPPPSPLRWNSDYFYFDFSIPHIRRKLAQNLTCNHLGLPLLAVFLSFIMTIIFFLFEMHLFIYRVDYRRKSSPPRGRR